MLDCWKIAISSPHTLLRQCIFPACVKDQTHATTFRKLQPRAALTGEPCADVLFWNLDASSGLGGVRHGICHAIFLYSKHVDAAPNARSRENTCCLTRGNMHLPSQVVILLSTARDQLS